MKNEYSLGIGQGGTNLMRFIMAALTFALAVALFPCQGFPATIYVKLKPVYVQKAKKPVKK
jgi:hypothetical protein